MSVNFRRRKAGGLDVIELPGDPEGAYIVIFHGFGADNTDLTSLSRIYQKSPRPTWIFPNGPIEIMLAPGFFGRAWFPIDIEAIQEAVRQKRIQEIASAFPSELREIRQRVEALLFDLEVPWSKLILGGFSQGAVLATDVALHATKQIAALLIFSGIAIDQENWKKLLHIHAGLPFFQSHGTQDTLLPLECAKHLESLLIEGGFKGKLLNFQGGHGIPSEVLAELNVFLSKLLKAE